MMADLGKVLIALGLLLVIAGAILMAGNRLHLSLGRLPGDFLYRGQHTTFYFPLMTSIVVSVALSAILALVARFRR